MSYGVGVRVVLDVAVDSVALVSGGSCLFLLPFPVPLVAGGSGVCVVGIVLDELAVSSCMSSVSVEMVGYASVCDVVACARLDANCGLQAVPGVVVGVVVCKV